jgi:hypothetical protein
VHLLVSEQYGSLCLLHCLLFEILSIGEVRIQTVVLKFRRDLVPLSADAEVSVCGSLSVSVIHEYKATEVCK